VQLIHMGGRLYDYHLGRFLSVDPVVQFPDNSQSLNPYTYVLNNPLAGTDPTGYEMKCSEGESCSTSVIAGTAATLTGSHIAGQNTGVGVTLVNPSAQGMAQLAGALAGMGSNGYQVQSTTGAGGRQDQNAGPSEKGKQSNSPTKPGVGGGEEDKTKPEKLDMVGSLDRGADAPNDFAVTKVEHIKGFSNETYVEFAERAGAKLVAYSESSGFEHCYRVCGSGITAASSDTVFEASIVTIKSHVGCGTNSLMCSTGFVDFGYSNHSHGRGGFVVNKVDTQIYPSLRAGQRLSGQDRNMPSTADYNEGRGLLSTPNGVVWHHGSRDTIIPIRSLIGN
jgi:hypothetical protein